MESKHIKLTVPKGLYQKSLEVVKELGYSNIQELTVEGLRNQVIELRRKQAIINLRKSFGSAKPRSRLTREQKEMIAERSTPKRAREIAKKYGVEDIAI